MTLHEWIQPHHLRPRRLQELRARFLAAEPIQHLVIRDFFVSSRLLRVRRAALRQHLLERNCDLYKLKQSGDLRTSRNAMLQEFYRFFSSQDFLRYVADLTGIRLGTTIDMSLSLYTNGDYLLPHDDHLQGRKIAYVMNLSQHFTTRDGGQLQLFGGKKHTPTLPVRSYIPQWNSLVLFRVTPGWYHQVQEVLSARKRLALSGWFHG